MIERIALKITNFIYGNAELDSELFEVYKYGAEITLSTLLNSILIIVASIVLSDMISGVVFLAVFILERSFVGGYHAKTYFMCNALFLLTYLSVYYLDLVAEAINNEDLYSRILTVLILMGLIPIIAFAPVKNENKPLSEKHSRICRMIGITAYIIISISALAFHYSSNKYGSFIIMTLSSVSVMILIEKMNTRRWKKW